MIYELLGLLPEDISGRKCYEIIGRSTECVPCATRQAIDRKEFVSIEKYVPELGLHLSCRSNPVMDGQGNVIRIVEHLRDITRQKETEEELRQSAHFLDNLMESIQDGLSILNPDLSIHRANRTIKNWHKQQAPLEGKKCYQAYHNREFPCDPCPSLLCLQSGVMENEEICVHTDIGIKWIEIFSYPLVNAENHTVEGVIEFVRDITKRKQAEEELKKIEWMLSSQQAPPLTADYTLVDAYIPPYGNLTELNTRREILDAVGAETLKNIVDDFLDMLATSVAVYERNGDYALGIFSSDWCRSMDRASYQLCGTEDREQALKCGKWLCHESCWNTAKQAIETGAPADVECEGGIRLYAVPIRASGEIIGTINVGYGDPPADISRLSELASKYGVDVKELIRWSNVYESRPPFVIEMAKRRVHSAAHLIGEIVERKQAEAALKESETTYRALFENSLDAIFLTVPDGKIFAANKAACEMMGMTESELIAGGRDKVVDKNDPRLSDALNQRALKKSFKGELNFKRKDGTSFPVEISTGVYQDIHISIIMDEKITHSDHFFPEETGIGFSGFLGNTPCRFSNNFKSPDDRILAFDIG